jgi:hypothetical protein
MLAILSGEMVGAILGGVSSLIATVVLVDEKNTSAIIFTFTFYLLLKPVSAVCGDTVPTNEPELNSYVSDCNTSSRICQVKGYFSSGIGRTNYTDQSDAGQDCRTNDGANKLEIEIVDHLARSSPSIIRLLI